MMLVSFDEHYPGRRALFLIHVTCRRTFLSRVNGFPALRVLFMCPTPSTPSTFLVCSCPVYRQSTTNCRSVSGLSCPQIDTLFTYHARLPRRTLRNLTVSYEETVPSVLSSAPLKTSSSSSTHFRGCMQVHGYRPGNHPSGSFQLCSSAIHGLRVRNHVSLWSVKSVDATRPAPHPSGRLQRSSPRIHALRLPVYTSSASFFMSVPGI
jgi:hypothetical protein